MAKYSSIVLVALIIFSSEIGAKGVDFKSIKERYVKYDAVVLDQENSYLFDVVADTLSVKRTNSTSLLILNNHSTNYSNDEIYRSSFEQIANLQAYTLVPDFKGYKRKEVELFNETHDADGSVFYDDARIIQFTYQALQDGAVAVSKYDLTYNNPLFVRSTDFQTNHPILKMKMTIKVHRDIDIGYKLVNVKQGLLEFKEYTKGNYRYYQWQASDVEPYTYESGEYFSSAYHCPFVVVYVKQTNINGRTKKYFGTVQDLYDVYKQFMANVNQAESDGLKQKVAEITNGLTDSEKAKAIYYWVQKNIKYVAYEQGLMGFVPDEADKVFVKRYGDCKGMTSLIVKMFELAGLKAYFSWVGTRHIPYDYDQMPFMMVDNHMVATYLDGDKMVVLDGTFLHLDYGVYPYHLFGKEVMIAISDKQYQIFKVPIVATSYSQAIDSIHISLGDNVINGIANYTCTGYDKLIQARNMDGVNADDYNSQLSQIFNLGNDKFTIVKSETHHLYDHDMPARFDYEFVLHDYHKSIDDEIYINLNLTKQFSTSYVDTIRTSVPLENHYFNLQKVMVSFTIPNGYEVIELPADSDYHSSHFSFNIKYRQQGNVVVMEREIKLEFLALRGNDLAKWNEAIRQLNKQYQLALALKKTND